MWPGRPAMRARTSCRQPPHLLRLREQHVRIEIALQCDRGTDTGAAWSIGVRQQMPSTSEPAVAAASSRWGAPFTK